MDDKTLHKKHHIIIRTFGKRKESGPTKEEYRNVSRRRNLNVSEGVKKVHVSHINYHTQQEPFDLRQ
jgi:hypothetical protein